MSQCKYIKDGEYSFNEGDILGAGSFGKVYKGYSHKNNKSVAIKQMSFELMSKHGEEIKASICSQITVMRKFTSRMQSDPCPYLVRHEDCFRTELYIYIIMELCEGGNLLQYQAKHNLSQSQVVYILYCLIVALQYLENMNIAHRDLKPENIFVSTEVVEGVQKTVFKVGDFGFAAQKQSYKQMMGTIPFMAPEIFRNEEYTSKVDVWALGLIGYQILFHELYYNGKNKWQVKKKVLQVPFQLKETQRQRISREMEEFIGVCLIKEQTARPLASQLLTLTLFKKFSIKVPQNVKNVEHQQKNVQIFDILQAALCFCMSIKQSANKFAAYELDSKRKTTFIRIYLLKRAYSAINRLTYSVLHKQNHCKLSKEHFQQLLQHSSDAEFVNIREQIQAECELITSLFNQQYKEFMQHVSQFGAQDAALIRQVVNEEPYDLPNPAVFQLQVRKWTRVLEHNTAQADLVTICESLLD